MHILLNNTGKGDHVPESERFVCTTKESCRAGFTRNLFKKLLIALTIGLVLVTIFWENSIADEDGVSHSISPKGIITGRSLNFHKNCQIKFGSYLQTSEEGNNTTETERTLGAIAIGPT